MRETNETEKAANSPVIHEVRKTIKLRAAAINTSISNYNIINFIGLVIDRTLNPFSSRSTMLANINKALRHLFKHAQAWHRGDKNYHCKNSNYI